MAENSDASPHASDDEDVQLMMRVREGDLEAFQHLVERHQGRVVNTVARMLGSDLDAEDIGQQVFIRVWKSASRYTPDAKFNTWLMTITRNLVFNEIRRRTRHPAFSLDHHADEDHHAPSLPDASATSPDDNLVQRELEDAIDAAIASLPENARMAVILRRYEDMAYEDIARVLKTTVPAVKSLLFRARGELREKLRKYLD